MVKGFCQIDHLLMKKNQIGEWIFCQKDILFIGISLVGQFLYDFGPLLQTGEETGPVFLLEQH